MSRSNSGFGHKSPLIIQPSAFAKLKIRMAGGVTLFGYWASPYALRVKWALKLERVPYEFVEEDFPKKSSLLLQYNPGHKQIPVL
ncbi:glutathione s-transferase, putative [Ricinus communis]|uniref:Glutathione S-transferase n=1 Tax=Ricinus communis TaxID=3988 RepID=B9RJS9_RICCO|nr:glutathione s-transferase, putative [Ricinus communis]